MRKLYNITLSFFTGIFATFSTAKISNMTVTNIPSMTEKDLINTMFLRSEFFENWSDTNFFVNPTLKTSKPLKYNEKWYLDFLKDSYSTGIVYNKPSDKFLELYKNWDSIKKQYKLDDFYKIEKDVNFLKNVTNFVYSFAKNKNMHNIVQRLEQNVSDLQLFKILDNKWELVSKTIIDNKYYKCRKNSCENIDEWYFAPNFNHVLNRYVGFFDYVYHWNPYKNDYLGVYLWVGKDKPNEPTIDENTGQIINWNIDYSKENNVKFFINEYFQSVIDENIRIQQGGNSSYENPNLNTQRIIFDFQIVNLKLDKKSIFRMILTIDELDNIVGGEISLFHKKGKNFDTDKLGFSFSFAKKKDNIFDFSIQINSYENNVLNVKKEIKGQIDIYEFLKAFFATALVPVVQNRSNFIETKYFENITYDTVLINFFALKYENFSLLFLSQNTEKLVISDNNFSEIKKGIENKILAFLIASSDDNRKNDIKKEHFIFEFLNFDFSKIETQIKHEKVKNYPIRVKVTVKKNVNSPFRGENILTVNFDLAAFWNQIKNDYEKIMGDIFLLIKDFYKEQIRTMFDLDNNTYVQGYNKKYGLLINNGFKIYPRYFYFSDKYQNLDVKLFSSYKNRFYTTKYGNVFNFDFSVDKNFDINQNEGYVFSGEKQHYYGLKYKKLEEQKIGYSVFELQAQKESEFYKYYDFNFGIYNWQELTKDGLFPTGQWWNVRYESCAWWNLFCHMKNGVIWVVNNIPGISQANQLVSGVGTIFKDTVNFFTSIFDVWKFSPALYNTVTNIFLMIVFMKLIRLI